MPALTLNIRASPSILSYAYAYKTCRDIWANTPRHGDLCQGQLNRVVPIERASMPGRTVVQWDKEDCSDMGMVKVDLLGLGMMAVMKDCLELIPRHYGKVEDLAQLPENDPQVYETLQRADTVGLFQVESRAQMASLPRNKPTKFYDIVVQVAIIRPGPIVGGNMNPYMRRRQGKEEVTYLHPSLVPVLKRTLGVPLFQEQTAADRYDSGWLHRSGGRRAPPRRRHEAFDGAHERARSQTPEGHDRTRHSILPTQDRVVQGISSFALYGFPESHAASFALIAYASAYFKVHYLAAFTCAMLNNQPMGFYMPAVLVKDAQRHGLRVRVIDVLHSDWRCTVEREADESLSLRMGLLYVKGLRQRSAQALIEARMRDGLFLSTDDLALRVPELNPRELQQLARVGALNSLGGVEHRRDALWQVEQAGRPVGPLLRQRDVPPVDEADTSLLRQMTTEERLVADYSGTGVTVGRHPMAYRRDELRRRRILSAEELQQHRDGAYVRAAGCVIARQRPGTAKGFIFLSMEDETGIMNVIIRPELYERERILISRGKFLLVEGKLQNQNTVVHVRAERVLRMPMSEVSVRSLDFH